MVNGFTEDDVLIDKGFADQTYLKSTGSGTGSQLRVRTEDEVNVEDYSYTIANFDASGRIVINDRYQDGILVSGQGHGLDTSGNGAPFTYATTGTSAVDTSVTPSRTLNDVNDFPDSKFFIRIVFERQLTNSFGRGAMISHIYEILLQKKTVFKGKIISVFHY